MSRICVLALIGLPAAGKTTFSRWLLEVPHKKFNVVHICFDDLLEFPILHAAVEDTDNNATLGEHHFKRQRQNIYKLLETLVESTRSLKNTAATLQSKIKISLAADFDDFLIICDDNNYYRSMRYNLFQFCRKHSLSYAQAYFEINWELSQKRNAKRDVAEKVPEELLLQMVNRLETPKHKWEANTLVIDADILLFDFDVVEVFVAKAFRDVPDTLTNIAKPIALQTRSPVHQLDIVLRRRITDLLDGSTLSVQDKQEQAALLNAKRKEILKMRREGQSEATIEEIFIKLMD